jgi:hypothetical protein
VEEGEMKTCNKCGMALPLDNFQRDSNLKSGRRGRCKNCTREDLLVRIQKDPEGYKEARRQIKRRYREGSPEKYKAQLETEKQKYWANRESKCSKSREHYRNNREKIITQKREGETWRNRTTPYKPMQGKSRWAVRHGLEKGTIIKPDSCRDCGKISRLAAHHEDYNFRLDVIWLCHSCHMKRHSPLSLTA